MSLLPPEAADEVLGDRRAIVTGSLFPPLVATPAPGGYRVSGRSSFGSGCDHATWMQCQAVIVDGGAPKIGPNGVRCSLPSAWASLERRSRT